MLVIAVVIVVHQIGQGGLAQCDKAVSHANGNKKAQLVLFAHLYRLDGPVRRRTGAQVNQSDPYFAGNHVPVVNLVKVVMKPLAAPPSASRNDWFV